MIKFMSIIYFFTNEILDNGAVAQEFIAAYRKLHFIHGSLVAYEVSYTTAKVCYSIFKIQYYTMNLKKPQDYEK